MTTRNQYPIGSGQLSRFRTAIIFTQTHWRYESVSDTGHEWSVSGRLNSPDPEKLSVL